MNGNPAYFVWLAELCGAGSPLPKKLLEAFGDIRAVYLADREDYISAGFSEDEAELLSDKDFSRANMIVDYCAENHVGLLTFESEYYPQALFALSSPPPVLYYKGCIEKFSDKAFITAIGSRTCSEAAYENGYNMCYKLSCSGVSVVTGAAGGADTACTLGALDAGGFCVAVLGSGINILYPFENSRMFSRLFRTGLVITEFSPYTEPKGVNFPIRNRLMAALSCAVLVIEAGRNSGALITAEYARELGRTVYAVPGDISNERCYGSNELIKSGAIAVTDANEMIEKLEYLYPATVSVGKRQKYKKLDKNDVYVSRRSRKKAKNGTENQNKQQTVTDPAPKARTEGELNTLNATERAVYDVILKEKTTADIIVRTINESSENVLSALTMLEIYGFAESLPGGLYTAK